MIQYLLPLIVVLLFLSSCGTFAAHDGASPASHHAQRKYDEAVRKGAVAPAENSNDDKK